MQLLHLDEINMRFYGAEHNNIEQGENIYKCNNIYINNLCLKVWNL
jgi:hypothetical protein